ncbi:MAG: mechanosensitive ion channel [Deltaproteobacteria bacterium]|jgi:potassium efflux system protein|nr:mechanosensitive ion channel [Deltaproteobacteria bacterium]
MMFKHSMRRSLGIMAALVLLMTGLDPSTVNGQDAPAGTSATPPAATAQSAADLSMDKLQLKRSEVEGSENLGGAEKENAIKILDRAISFRKSFDEYEQQSKNLLEQINTAPQRIATIKSELIRPIRPPETGTAKTAGKSTLELAQVLQEEIAQLAVAKDAKTAWYDQISKLKELLGHLPQNIATAKGRLKTVDQELQSQTDGPTPAVVAESRRLMLLAEQLKLKAEIKLNEQQLNSQEILLSLAMAEHELATREVTRREALVKAWQAEVTEQVQEEAAKVRQDAEEARDKAPELATALKDQYDINIALSAELEKLAEQATATTSELDKVNTQLKEIEEDFALATERVESLVLTETIGMALRRQRQLLPSVDKYQRGSYERKRKMSEIREIQYRLERERRELTDVESRIDEIIDSLVYLKPDTAEKLRPEVRDMLNDRRMLLAKLQAGYNQYFKALQNLEFADQQLVARAKAYADFLDAHLVWIRSSSIINLTDLKNSLAVSQELLNPANWKLFAGNLYDSSRAQTGEWTLGLIVIAVFLFGRRRARRKISQIAAKVKIPQEDRILLTVWVLALTAYLAVGFAVLMFFLGWQLLHLPGAHDFTRAIANGLVPAAGYLVGLRFFYHLVRRNGLAHTHFRWNDQIRHSLRLNLWWFTPVEILTAFLVYAMAAVQEIEFGDSMAKLALIVQVLALSAFFGRILRFSGGVVTALLKNYPTGWLARLRYIWWPVAVGLPLVLAALVAGGYFLSALQLREYIGMTVALLMSLIVFNSLALRWLTIARRRFARREAQRKREAQQAADRKITTGQPAAVTDEDKPPPPADHEIGLAEISEQTQSLLRTVMFVLVALGLWAIWEPVFPAFGILNDIHLWSYSGTVDGVATAIPISLANLIMAIVVIVITVIASRNLPGLLEITVLNRLPMDAGARYAFTSVCRYAITVIGIILAFNTIGFKWSSVQWLIAALGVGLGFGLQEIVANFICGLIVLFERPFRVGDTVTIGEVSGTVSLIRIRATTVLDWDRKELIVPNKEFITGRLINWSLSDPISRFIIRVGIAYGSDTELAEKLLLKVLDENPMVLKEPRPTAYFLGFGDNSLNFELRLFINNIDHRLPVQHEIHKAIDREFRKAGIVIAFPQRDVHLDADRPLKVQVVPDGSNPSD